MYLKAYFGRFFYVNIFRIKMKVLEIIKILFKFFKNKEKRIFNKQNILTDSDQKASIFKVCSKKGQLSYFIGLINKDLFKISSYQNILIIYILKLLSRSNYKFIYKCQSKLAKVLLKTQK